MLWSVNFGDSPDNSERVLWEGAPRPRRIFSILDLFLVPLTLAMATFIVAYSLVVPGTSWPIRVLAWVSAVVVVVGRFVRKWIVKSHTTYVVTDRRALVYCNGEVYEHQELAGVKPEMTGGAHNRIVTFGDALESFMVSLGSVRKPEANDGMGAGAFTAPRGDGSKHPIRFYDLDPVEAERLMSILKATNFRRSSDEAKS